MREIEHEVALLIDIQMFQSTITEYAVVKQLPLHASTFRYSMNLAGAKSYFYQLSTL